ncbi:MAG: hypothetical protein K1X78_23180 [Verrucomicrobiaceae bacterium]|nr:hypothetical protein [Verrucomicrobiaceae bacterium]
MNSRLLLCSCLALSVSLHAADDFTVLSPDAGQRFERWLTNEFNALVDARSAAFEKMIKSEAACKQWQQERRAFFIERIGGLPERTPLNPQITGALTGKGYRVEKIMLETRPSFHLTANLYLPDTPPPWPAVIVPCGHSHEGKAVGQYQLVCMLLARHGLAAMCYDPIGQGERYQMLDLEHKREVFDDAPHVKTPHPNTRLMCTTEHTMMGLSSALLGANVAQYRIWDGMRVIDYLQSRKDIIADKIGCTGNSGGGTETAYLMALDERIVAAAPGCFLTTFRKLIEIKGPQDGEQNIFGQIAFGMDEADYCIMRAPKPTLICAGTRDATFDFGGTWDLFRDAKRFYSRLGHADAIDLVAPDAPHGFTLQLREAVTRFFSRHLLGKDVVVREIEHLPDSFTDDQLRDFSKPDWTAEQLQCTPKGQVLLLPGERSVFQINTDLAMKLKAERAAKWSKLDDSSKTQLIRETISAQPIEKSDVQTLGSIERANGSIRKLALTVAPNLQIPALAFVPKKPNGNATLYLHGTSKTADLATIEAMMNECRVVLAADLRGIGETETGFTRKAYGAGRFGRDLLEVLTAYLMGKNYIGYRTEDIEAWLHYLQSGQLTGTAPKQIDLIAVGETTIPSLHAAALHRDAFAHVTLRQMIPSWESIVTATETFDQAANIVHGALRNYDLPELMDFVGRDKITLTEPVDVMGKARP